MTTEEFEGQMAEAEAAPKPKDWTRWDIPLQISMCQPGCRMVLLVAYAEKSGDVWGVDFDVLPVHALQAKVVASFQNTDDGDPYPDFPTSVAEARERGWTSEHVGTEHSVVVITGDYGLIDSEEFFELNGGAPQMIVAAPWPESEDTESLAWAFDRLKERAIGIALRIEQELKGPKS